MWLTQTKVEVEGREKASELLNGLALHSWAGDCQHFRLPAKLKVPWV